LQKDPNNNNNNNNSNNTKKTSEIKVNFDFNKMTPTKKGLQVSGVTQVEPNLFSKYSSLDLITVLCKYTNDANVSVVYNLAINGIEVIYLIHFQFHNQIVFSL
jgi:hypothetical protein